jgi:hypothetical protein
VLGCLEQRTQKARRQRDIGKGRRRRRRRGVCGIANGAGSTEGRAMMAVRGIAEASGQNPLFLGLAMRVGVDGRSRQISHRYRETRLRCVWNSDGEVEGDLIFEAAGT